MANEAQTVLLYDGQIEIKFSQKGHKYYRRATTKGGIVKYKDINGEKKEVKLSTDFEKLGSASVISKSALDKPELYNWFTNVAVQEYKRAIESGEDSERAEGLAKGARFVKMKAAGKIGNEIHEYANLYIRSILDKTNTPKIKAEYTKEAKYCIRQLIDWFDENVEKFLDTEHIVYDPELDVVGTTDIVCILKGGKLGTIDLKSGTYVYAADVMQVGFYRRAYMQQEKVNLDEAIILHFKDKKRIVAYRNLNHEANNIAFECAVYLNNWRTTLNI